MLPLSSPSPRARCVVAGLVIVWIVSGCAHDTGHRDTGAVDPSSAARHDRRTLRRLSAVYRRSCRAGEPVACERLGLLYEQGTLQAGPHRRSRSLYEQTCNTRYPLDPAACLARAYLTRACALGAAGACGALGRILGSGRVGAVDDAIVDGALVHGCSGGNDASCVELERRAVAGGDPSRVAGWLARTCTSGRSGCAELASLHARGLVGEPDLDLARTLYGDACRAGNGRACVALGDMQQIGRGGALDAAAAHASFSSACRRREARGCERLARAVEHGRGTKADPLRAFELYREARRLYQHGCELGDQAACTGLGALMREASGGEADADAGLALQHRACDLGSAAGCVAWMQDPQGIAPARARRAAPVLARACSANDADACFWQRRIDVGDASALERGCRLGHGGACNAAGLARFPNGPAARALLERACALGDAPGCYHLAIALELEREDEAALRALGLYRRACVWRHGAACLRLGAMLSSGEPVAIDMVGATRAYRDGCELGSADACFEVGVLRLEGTRVTPDPEAGIAFLRRGCRNGAHAACIRIALAELGGSVLDTNAPEALTRLRNAPEALIRLDRSCSSGSARACILLAEIHRRGREVRADEVRARQLYAAAAEHAEAHCERQLSLCYGPGAGVPKDSAAKSTRDDATTSDPLPRHWQNWEGRASLTLDEPPACDARLERACGDAHDALAGGCELGAPTCQRGALLVRRLAAHGLGPGVVAAEKLERVAERHEQACKRDPRRCEAR